MVMDPKFRPFLQKLVRSANATVLPRALEEKMMLDLSLQLEQLLENIVYEELSSDDQSRYQSMVRRGVEQSEVNKFLTDNIADLDKRMADVIKKFENDYLEWMTDNETS